MDLPKPHPPRDSAHQLGWMPPGVGVRGWACGHHLAKDVLLYHVSELMVLLQKHQGCLF